MRKSGLRLLADRPRLEGNETVTSFVSALRAHILMVSNNILLEEISLRVRIGTSHLEIPVTTGFLLGPPSPQPSKTTVSSQNPQKLSSSESSKKTSDELSLSITCARLSGNQPLRRAPSTGNTQT